MMIPMETKFRLEWRTVETLHPNPLNVRLFGPPSGDPKYTEVLESIRKIGLQEPLLARQDGVLLSGHLRHAALLELYGSAHNVPVRIVGGQFPSELAEAEYLVELNAKRRQLTDEQVARVYSLLKGLSVASGGVQVPRGRPKKGAESDTFPLKGKSRDRAAKVLAIGAHRLEESDVVFNTENVPDDAKEAVRSGRLSRGVVAKIIRTVRKTQGGTITDPSAVSRMLALETSMSNPATVLESDASVTPDQEPGECASNTPAGLTLTADSTEIPAADDGCTRSSALSTKAQPESCAGSTGPATRPKESGKGRLGNAVAGASQPNAKRLQFWKGVLYILRQAPREIFEMSATREVLVEIQEMLARGLRLVPESTGVQTPTDDRAGLRRGLDRTGAVFEGCATS